MDKNKKHEKPIKVKQGFDEAMKRLVRVNIKTVIRNIKRPKKK